MMRSTPDKVFSSSSVIRVACFRKLHTSNAYEIATPANATLMRNASCDIATGSKAARKMIDEPRRSRRYDTHCDWTYCV